MKTIQTIVYNLDELSPPAKEKAREWYREGALQYDWWDFTYEDAKTCLKFLGWTITDITFSGFSSQGDGACFMGTWNAKDVNAKGLRSHAPKDAELARLAKVFRSCAVAHPDGTAATTRIDYHYSHEGTVTVEPDFDADLNAFVKASRDAMRWIYRQLEAEYTYLTSDEQVDDNIRANEYTFTADGKRFG